VFTVRPLDAEDKGYVLSSWRESHKQSPGNDKLPWAYYKSDFGKLFADIVNGNETTLLGAYARDGQLVGWLAMTRGKRVNVLHWVQVKYELEGKRLRRLGIMSQLLREAQLGSPFVYTLRARRDRARLPDGSATKSLDESLVAALRAKGIVAEYVPLKEWVR
jgi:hypothetical protein